MDTVVLGGFLSIIVSLLKKIPWVRQYPKVVVFLFAAVIAGLQSQGMSADNWLMVLLQQIAVMFGTAVATYETVLKPIESQS